MDAKSLELKSRYNLSAKLLTDKLFYYTTIGFSILFVFAFATLFVYMLVQGGKGYSLKNFSITGKIWSPTNHIFGIAGFIVSTLLILAIGLAISIPVSCGFCLFIYGYFGVKMRRLFLNFLTLLAGVPSVVFGLVGYFIFIEFFSIPFSVIVASIILSIMVLPLLMLFISTSLDSIPKEYLDASLALGATKTETIYKIYLTNIRFGLITGILAATTRILGETIAVTMLIGGNTSFNTNPNGPSASMTSIIAVDFQESSGAWRDALFAVGTTLLIFITLFNGLILFISWKLDNRKQQIESFTNKIKPVVVKKKNKRLIKKGK